MKDSTHFWTKLREQVRERFTMSIHLQNMDKRAAFRILSHKHNTSDLYLKLLYI